MMSQAMAYQSVTFISASLIYIGLFVSGLCNFFQKVKLFLYFKSSELLPHLSVFYWFSLSNFKVLCVGQLRTAHISEPGVSPSPTLPPVTQSLWQPSLIANMTFPPSPQLQTFPMPVLHMPCKAQTIMAWSLFHPGLEAVTKSTVSGLLHGVISGIPWPFSHQDTLSTKHLLTVFLSGGCWKSQASREIPAHATLRHRHRNVTFYYNKETSIILPRDVVSKRFPEA